MQAVNFRKALWAGLLGPMMILVGCGSDAADMGNGDSGGSDGGAAGGSDGGAANGKDYQVCTDPLARAKYLTSPWTYHALASGRQTYTVAQYQALPGYGTTLPPLPSYIADLPPTTEAAVIFAPGALTSAPAYD